MGSNFQAFSPISFPPFSLRPAPVFTRTWRDKDAVNNSLLGEAQSSKQFLLEEKHRSLQKVLVESLGKKRFVEMCIRRQLEELKRLEISLEKCEQLSRKSAALAWGTAHHKRFIG